MSENEGNSKLVESNLIGEHGPGPPPPTNREEHHGLSNTDQQPRSYANTDDRLGKELEQKEQELRRLRGEVQTYIMKIRGYQTLEHLLQESKQECTRYRQKHDDVALKLDSLNRRLVLNHPVPTPQKNAGVTTVGDEPNDLGADHHHHRQQQRQPSGNWSRVENTAGREPGQNRTPPPAGMSEAAGRSVDAKEAVEMELLAGAGGKPVNWSTPASTASSPSFVRINSNTSTEQSPTSLDLRNFCRTIVNDTYKQPAPTARSPSRQDAAELSRSASLEVQQLTDLVRGLSPGGSGGEAPASLVQDLSSNLIRTGISVRNLEKQNRVQKVMIDQMSATIDELTRQNRDKERTIADLQAQCEKFQSVVGGLQSAREAAISEARQRYIDVGTEPSELQNAAAVSSLSGEWMQVEKRPAAVATGGEPGGNGSEDVQVTAVSTVEVELRKRVEKLNASIFELVTVNRSWDEHCKKVESDHGQQVAALTNDLTSARHRLDDLGDVERRFEELEQADERKQVDFDQLLLNAKKQREIEAMAKEEALNQLHQEKRYRANAEERCAELDRRVDELDHRVRELQALKQGGIVGASMTGARSATMLSAGDRDLELQILREQVTVFKEDFDHERRDREAAREALERMQATLNTKTAQLEDTQTKLFRALEELKRAQNDNSQFRSRFERVAEEIKVLQRQTRPPPTVSTASPPRAAGNYVTAPTPFYYVSSQSTAAPAAAPVYPLRPNGQTAASSYPRVVQTAATNYRQSSRVLDESAWPCPKCTFLNADANMTCEMCGLLRRELLLQPRNVGTTTYDAAGRTVAGLPIHRPALPNSSPAWPPLAHGSLETDQPSPSV
jgi:hypothetical protein